MAVASILGLHFLVYQPTLEKLGDAMREQERLLREIREDVNDLRERLDLLEERVAPAWITVTRVERRVNPRLLQEDSLPPYRILIMAMEEADLTYPVLGWSETWTDNQSGRAILSFLGVFDEECPGDGILCGGGLVEYDSKFYDVYVIIQLEPPQFG